MTLSLSRSPSLSLPRPPSHIPPLLLLFLSGSELLHLESLNEYICLWNRARIKANEFPWQQHKLGIDLRQTGLFIYSVYFGFNWFHLITINVLLMFWTHPTHTHTHTNAHTHTHVHTHTLHTRSAQSSPGHDVLWTNSTVHGVCVTTTGFRRVYACVPQPSVRFKSQPLAKPKWKQVVEESCRV